MVLQGTIKDGYHSLVTGESWEIPVLGGKLCDIGFFCKGGLPTACSPGKYCDRHFLSVDGPPCDAGYYC